VLAQLTEGLPVLSVKQIQQLPTTWVGQGFEDSVHIHFHDVQDNATKWLHVKPDQSRAKSPSAFTRKVAMSLVGAAALRKIGDPQ
jgi:hypothetical protein